MTIISITVPDELADQLPAELAERQAVVVLGLREWRLRQALSAYQRGEGSLAYAAQQAGVTLREIVPLAYAHGLTPPTEGWGSDDDSLTIEQASQL